MWGEGAGGWFKESTYKLKKTSIIDIASGVISSRVKVTSSSW